MARSVWFIGIPVELTGDVELPTVGDDVRWTRAADRHLTLHHLGRVADDDASGAWRAVPELDLPSAAAVLRWERFGRGALAVVLDDTDGRLALAAAACGDAARTVLEVEGEVDPRGPYRPHVTLARLPRRAKPPSAQVVRSWPVAASAVGLGALTLFRTRPPGEVDRYEVVARHPATR